MPSISSGYVLVVFDISVVECRKVVQNSRRDSNWPLETYALVQAINIEKMVNTGKNEKFLINTGLRHI